MKRLLRVSFDIFISSVTPILTWFLLSIILDKKLINVFTLTYPLQCLSGIITAIFGMGASICIYKDRPLPYYNGCQQKKNIFFQHSYSILYHHLKQIAISAVFHP